MARELLASIPRAVKNRLLTADYTAPEARCPQHIPIARIITETIAAVT